MGRSQRNSLSIIAEDDPLSCSIYGRDNNLLDQPVQMRFKTLGKRDKKLLRLKNQAKLWRCRTTPKCKFSHQITRINDHEHALSIDKHDGNNKMDESIKLETDQQHDCDTYKHMGKGSSLEGNKLVRAHFVFDVKHYGRHKDRLLADRNQTDVPLSSVYSGVVSLRGITLVLFAAELNQLDSWGNDVENACLEAFTKEKVRITAGRKFEPLEGHALIINKTLCGIRTSGLR